MQRYAFVGMLCIILMGIAAQCGAAPAGQDRGPNLKMEVSFARITTQNGVIYLTLANDGDGSDKLLSAETDVADR